MPDRLLYQSEAEQLVPEGGLVIGEPEVLFSVFLGASGIQGKNFQGNEKIVISLFIVSSAHILMNLASYRSRTKNCLPIAQLSRV